MYIPQYIRHPLITKMNPQTSWLSAYNKSIRNRLSNLTIVRLSSYTNNAQALVNLEQNIYANDASKQVIKVSMYVYFSEKILLNVDSYGSLPVTYLPFVYLYTAPFECPHHPS